MSQGGPTVTVNASCWGCAYLHEISSTTARCERENRTFKHPRPYDLETPAWCALLKAAMRAAGVDPEKQTARTPGHKKPLTE